jgi:transposase
MEALHSQERREWGMKFKYDLETKERAVRMFEERRKAVPDESLVRTYGHLSGLIAVPAATIRGWVERSGSGAPERPMTAGERDEIKALKREVAELKRANEILKAASAFFAAAELDRRLK